MTGIDTRQETTIVRLHAVYPDRSYSVGTVGDYFVGFTDAFYGCIHLTLYRQHGPTEFAFLAPGYQGLVHTGKKNVTLDIDRLRIDSPMELAVIAQGGLAAVLIYSVHLFVRAVSNPGRIGAWLPQLIAGWERGWKEAAEAKTARHVAEQEEEEVATALTHSMLHIAQQLKATGVKPEQITTLGAGEPPEELAEVEEQNH